MRFIHEDPEFRELIAIVQKRLSERGVKLSEALVEKDYWVTHALWSLHDLGLEVWFKGGTSLSKGFGLIQRFSEDLDIKIAPGRTALPKVTNWTSEKGPAQTARKAFFEAVAGLKMPGIELRLNEGRSDAKWRNAEIEAHYEGFHLVSLEPSMKPFVLLEVGDARVRPFVARSLFSFIHDHLQQAGQLADYVDNRPSPVRCIHPLVTLIEKLDAISRRFAAGKDPADFIRHYEDAAHTIERMSEFPGLDGYKGPEGLAQEMLEEKQIRSLPNPDDPAFNPGPGDAWTGLESAHEAINGMFWGPRIELVKATEIIRAWSGDLNR